MISDLKKKKINEEIDSFKHAYLSGDILRAKWILERLIELYDLPTAYLYLARLYREQGFYELALELLRKASIYKPVSDELNKWGLFNRNGYVLEVEFTNNLTISKVSRRRASLLDSKLLFKNNKLSKIIMPLSKKYRDIFLTEISPWINETLINTLTKL